MNKPPFTPERIKVIFFDINETLLDPYRTLKAAFLQIWEDMSARWDPGEDITTGEKVWEAYRSRWRALRPPPHRYEAHSEALRRKVKALSEALEQWDLHLSEGSLRSFFQKVSEQQDRAPQLYPGAAEVLEHLAKSYRLAILSNGLQDKQTKRLRAAGQIPPLSEELMFFSSGLGARKPQPAMFRMALSKAGIRPDQAVMVGNSWTKDIMGAVKVHMHAVWFHPQPKQKHFRRRVGSARIYVVSRFEQLLPLFGSS